MSGSKRHERLKRPMSSSLRRSEPNLSGNSNECILPGPISKAMPLSRPTSASVKSTIGQIRLGSPSARPLSGSSRQLYSSQGQIMNADRQVFTPSKSSIKNASSSNDDIKARKKSVSFMGDLDKIQKRTLNRCPTPASSSKLREDDLIASQDKVPLDKDFNLHNEIHLEKLSLEYEMDNGEEFYARLENENEYTLTPLQTAIYNSLFPNSEENKKAPADGSFIYTARAIRFTQEINFSDLQLAVNKIASLYPILESVFFRNEKILDADVVGNLPGSRNWDPDSTIFLQKMESSELENDDPEILADFTTKWMRNNSNFQNLFRILYISLDHNVSNPYYTLIFVGSTIILDYLSIVWLTREIMSLYDSITKYRKCGYQKAQILEFVSGYKLKEKTSFLQFSQTCIDSKFSMNFWRTQCVEYVQETVEYKDREEFLKQIRKLEIEKYNLEGSKESLTKRLANLSNDLKALTQQRKKLDSGSNGEGEMTQFTDPTTKEVIVISVEAKDALIQSVLGIDHRTDGMVSFLDKHGVPKDVQRKINASTLPFEKFAELNPDSLVDISILARERRKILALAEYVSNRIRESFHEQHKIKGTYERRILKTKRDLEKVTETLATVKERLEINDDMTMRLNALLNPPIYEERILPLNLDRVMIGPYDKDLYLNQTDYASISFTVDEDVVNQLRSFREAFLTSKKSYIAEGIGSGSSSGEVLSSDDSDTGKFDEKTQTHQRKIRNSNSVCIAAYCVLLRHISGQEKFSIGLTQSYRFREMLVGPLSDTHPLKIDMSKKNLEFRSLYSKMYKSLFHARSQGVACPLTKVAKTYPHVKHLPIRFEYYSYKDLCTWEKAGITVDDLLDNSVESSTSNFNWTKLWKISESDLFDLKLVLVETDTSIQGRFFYRSEKFSAGQITKWMVKFQSILSSIEYSQRKIKISTMISRLYHSMWTNSTDSLLAASSFSSFADLQSQIELNAHDDESDDNHYSQDTLSASLNAVSKSPTKLPLINSDRSNDKTPKEIKSTDTIHF